MSVRLMPTPRDVVLRDGTAQLYRFRPEGPTPSSAPVLLVPSLINRWYVLDLRPGTSLVETLVGRGLDVWCLDWGAAEDEDRFLSWEAVLDRLGRAVRRVKRETGHSQAAILGYCMGATLSGIWTALNPRDVSAFINLAGPFDFSEGGFLARMTDPRWFDVDAIADAGNVHPLQMQSGFVALRPTQQVSKWVALAQRATEPGFREAFESLESWANDNIPFPAEAYRTYIRDLYQNNALVAGDHRVRGTRVDLSAIRCPLLTISAERDTICPLPAARALNERVSSEDQDLVVVPGGHVGAVVGSRAPKKLYPAIADWLEARLGAAAPLN